MAIWFDVDDLVRYFRCNVRPTGIQRLSLAMFRALAERGQSGEPIYFCRRQSCSPYFRLVDFRSLDAAVTAVMDRPHLPPPPALPARTRPDWLNRLPARQRQSLGEIRKALRDLIRAGRALIAPPLNGGRLDIECFDKSEISFAPGDWLINLGSSWSVPYQPACLDYLKANGAKFAILIHDMIPELFPEWSAEATLAEFRAWLRHTVPRADMLFAISDQTASDIAHCLSAAGQPVPPIARLRIGAPLAPPVPDIPSIQPAYVLLVSTFEVRKNHALMFRVWQKLLERHGPAATPELIFAGKPGWLTGDFMRQLENAKWLGGKIRLCESPTDAELALLYRHCLFSVYPSFYEGWGLPVSESLAYGKMVAASNRASIPEAGGAFCAYFDPENIYQATDVIEDLIRHPEHVAAMERRIARDYKPWSWQDAAHGLLRALAERSNQTGRPAVIHEAA